MVNREVKVYGAQESPFSKRVEIALKMKGVEYEYVEEDLLMKSLELLKYNPIHQKVPVFLHNGVPIVESLVILEYIDETWQSGPFILPKDPHDRATSRFWANFLDDKVFGVWESPFSKRVEIALKMKGVEYEYIEEDFSNKSLELLKYNPIHKKVPVFLHNGMPIVESLVILEYIDETWKSGTSILPKDPHERATSRFWAKLIDDKLLAAVIKLVKCKSERQDAIVEIDELLSVLENELKDKKFFGGESIGLVDIAANIIALWLDVIQEGVGVEILTKETHPKLYTWSEEYMKCSIIKETLPPKDDLLAFWLSRFQSSAASR